VIEISKEVQIYYKNSISGKVMYTKATSIIVKRRQSKKKVMQTLQKMFIKAI